PVTYSLDGVQYVAVVGGFRATQNYYESNYSRLLVFRLGGEAELPPEQEVSQLPLNPPENFGGEALISQGEGVFDNYCASCHGLDGQARGNFPDLRFSPALTSQPLWNSIVLDGARVSNGMVAFGEVLDEEQSQALRAY